MTTRKPFNIREAFIIILTALLAPSLACSQPARQRQDNAPPAASTPRPTPTRRPTPTPPPVDKDAKTEKGSGNFEQYKFTYEKTGEKVTAVFNAPKLPYTDSVVVGAARAVILSAYGERMENFPRRVPWDYNDTKHAIKLEGDRHDYVFVPVRDENREIPTIVFWRVEKGTVE